MNFNGPWILDFTETLTTGYVAITSTDHPFFGFVAINPSTTEDKAYLISAAPELYDVTTKLLARFELMAKNLPIEQHADANETIALAKKAIAKAKGNHLKKMNLHGRSLEAECLKQFPKTL